MGLGPDEIQNFPKLSSTHFFPDQPIQLRDKRFILIISLKSFSRENWFLWASFPAQSAEYNLERSNWKTTRKSPLVLLSAPDDELTQKLTVVNDYWLRIWSLISIIKIVVPLVCHLSSLFLLQTFVVHFRWSIYNNNTVKNGLYCLFPAHRHDYVFLLNYYVHQLSNSQHYARSRHFEAISSSPCFAEFIAHLGNVTDSRKEWITRADETEHLTRKNLRIHFDAL